MKTQPKTRLEIATASHAVLVLAEIKAATAAFDRGQVNVFDALDAVALALEALRPRNRRGRSSRVADARPPAAA